MVVCIDFGVDRLEGVPARPYISGRDRVTWKILAAYSWLSTVGVLLQHDRVVSLYSNKFYAYLGSYKRGKVYL